MYQLAAFLLVVILWFVVWAVANNQELLIKVAHEKVVAHAKQIEEDLIADGFSPAWEMPQPDKLDDEDASTQGQHWGPLYLYTFDSARCLPLFPRGAGYVCKMSFGNDGCV